MSRTIRWGVIGAAGIARRRTIPEGIVPAAGAELAAVFDPNAAANAEVARAFGARPADSLEELLSLDLEAVYVASPPGAHRAQCEACARAGKHVLCEKPLGLTVEDARAVVEACRRAGVKLGTGFMMRFHTQHRAALELLRQGRLGQPVLGRAQLSCWYPPIPGAWRQDPATGGGGSLIDMGSHCIDLLEMFLGPAVRVGCATGRTVHAYRSEDSAVATLHFANGALGIVDAFFCIPDAASQNRLELYGTRGSILAEGTIGQGDRGRMVAWLEPEAGQYDAQQARENRAGRPIEPEPLNTYRAEIEAFSQAVLTGGEPVCGGDLGLRSQVVLQACYAAAASGRCVEVGCGEEGV